MITLEASQMLTSADVAARLGVTRTRVRGMVHEGRLSAVRIPGVRESLFDASQVASLNIRSRQRGVQEVADRLGVTRWTVREYVKSGKL